jgi:hypothetical protein
MWSIAGKLAPLGALASIQLLASITQVGSPAALAPNASLQWDAIGVAGTTFSGQVTGTAGSVGVTGVSSSLDRVDESFLWTGSFSLNDFLLSNADTGDPITFTFNTPVQGVGTFVQGDIFGAFSVTLTAYSGATNLGSFSVNGTNTGAEDGSAPFLGVLSDTANITNIVLTELDVSPNNLAIDTLYLTAPSTSTPEPGTLATTAFLAAAILLYRMLRRGRHA